MLSEPLFEDFLTLENFNLAFQRLQTAPRNLYKELYYEDLQFFGLFLDENIKLLLNEIEQEIYKPEGSYKVFIPKKNNLVRPLSLLKFKDLLVYQAVINKIADDVYDDVSSFYNNIVFGNVFNTSKDNEKDRIFFFKPWINQWRKFEQKTQKCYEAGYKFLAEFDIASFFDTIDHYILKQILEENYKLDNRITALLLELLEAFTSDSSHKTFRGKHGIPQGPIGSSFLADLYLLHLDLEVKNTKLDIKYLRYVDDIRIFSKDDITAQKAIACLDLFARDLGLIPQANKILISEIDDLNKLLRHQKSKLSLISKEHKKRGGSLKAKTHRNLKKRFLDCFNQNSAEEYLDKTLIDFSLYKLNRDDDIKDILLRNWKSLYVHFEAILFYLKKHFSEDQEIKNWLIQVLADENVLFHHTIALVLKFFPDLEFVEDVYRRYMLDSHRHWLIQYFMLRWLYNNKKCELISYHTFSNYFLRREANKLKFKISQDIIHTKIFVESLLKSKDSLEALQGIYSYPEFYSLNNLNSPENNEYIKHIFSADMTDFISYTLKHSFLIPVPESFFSRRIWIDEKIYKELNISFKIFFQNRNINPSMSLLSLNSFNHLIYDRVCEILSVNKPNKEYGANLYSNCIDDHLPIMNKYFTDINDQRNQRTEAHPYDRDGNLRIRIQISELDKLIKKERKALEELCNFSFSAPSTTVSS